MKTFEEKWTAWLDDQLSGHELSEFEASLPDKAAAQAEKAEVKKLGELLKRELSAHSLKNEEFFSHQLRERIVQESGGQRRERARRSPTSSWWTIPRLLWAGTASLAVFLICTVFVMHQERPAEESQYLTQILNARVDPVVSPNATVSIFEVKQDRVTVLWTEGLANLAGRLRREITANALLAGGRNLCAVLLTITAATPASQAAEKVWSGLVMAENVYGAAADSVGNDSD